MSFDLEKYFDRIAWHPSGESPLEALNELHWRHLLAIPFENLDVYANKDISLDPDAIFEKLVLNKRGGYCFEMNSLLCHAVAAMGYEVTPHLSRIWREGSGFGGFTHRVNIVSLDGKRYILDVGFGGNCFQTPLLIEEAAVQKQYFNTYMVQFGTDTDIIVQCLENNRFVNMLGIIDKPAVQEDFEIGNFFTSHYPSSFFAGNIICVMPTEFGKYSLFNDRLTIVENGDTRYVQVDKLSLPSVLKRYFTLDPEGLV